MEVAVQEEQVMAGEDLVDGVEVLEVLAPEDQEGHGVLGREGLEVLAPEDHGVLAPEDRGVLGLADLGVREASLVGLAMAYAT